MKFSKKFTSYLIAWGAVFIVFNIIAFTSPAMKAGYSGSTGGFWVGYLFILISLAVQLFVNYKFLNTEVKEKLFLSIPSLKASIGFVAAAMAVGGIFILVPFFPEVVGGVIAAIITCIFAVKMSKIGIAVNEVERIGENVKQQTFFIKSMTAEAEALMAAAKTDGIKVEVRKVYEAFRYADPMSNDALSGVENRISDIYIRLEYAVGSGDENAVKSVTEELVAAIKERNIKCKLFK